MYEQEKSFETRERTKTAEWEKPELRKLEAGDAEGASNTGTDNTVFS